MLLLRSNPSGHGIGAGEEHDIDAFFGRTPKGQMKTAEKLKGFVQIMDIR